jgi:hypothetical protein
MVPKSNRHSVDTKEFKAPTKKHNTYTNQYIIKNNNGLAKNLISSRFHLITLKETQ